MFYYELEMTKQSNDAAIFYICSIFSKDNIKNFKKTFIFLNHMFYYEHEMT